MASPNTAILPHRRVEFIPPLHIFVLAAFPALSAAPLSLRRRRGGFFVYLRAFSPAPPPPLVRGFQFDTPGQAEPPSPGSLVSPFEKTFTLPIHYSPPKQFLLRLPSFHGFLGYFRVTQRTHFLPFLLPCRFCVLLGTRLCFC